MAYLSQAIGETGISSDGCFTQRCAQILRERFAIPAVFMTSSCSAALELAAMVCRLGPGDEVILPSFTFSATANAILRTGAKPVFLEVRPDTLNLDENLVESAITRRTRAIFPVHYAGIACEMDRLMAVARKHDLLVVEDAAQGVNGFYRGRALGTIGDFGAYSFHSTKDYTGGEGGALCARSLEIAARAEIIREKGTNRSRFLRGEVDKYTWVEVGASYSPSEISCAFLCAQLEAMDTIKSRRRKIFERYVHELSELENRGWLRLPRVPEGCETNYHMCYVLLPDQQVRDHLLGYFREHRICASFHYVPLHCSPMGRRLGYSEGDLPLTEQLSGRLLRLPLYPDLQSEDQLKVIQCLRSFFHKSNSAPCPPRVRSVGSAVMNTGSSWQ